MYISTISSRNIDCFLFENLVLTSLQAVRVFFQIAKYFNRAINWLKLDRVDFSHVNFHSAINHNRFYEREEIRKSSFPKQQRNVNNMNKRHKLLYSLIPYNSPKVSKLHYITFSVFHSVPLSIPRFSNTPYNSPKVNIMSVKIDMITYFKSIVWE